MISLPPFDESNESVKPFPQTAFSWIAGRARDVPGERQHESQAK
jgi:hypothetical protein